MNTEIAHSELEEMGRAGRLLKVYLQPVTVGDRTKWRLAIDDNTQRRFRLRAWRGGERLWSKLDNAMSYVWSTLPTVKEVMVCRTQK